MSDDWTLVHFSGKGDTLQWHHSNLLSTLAYWASCILLCTVCPGLEAVTVSPVTFLPYFPIPLLWTLSLIGLR